MMSKEQKEASKKDSAEESQQDIAADEKGVHNLERENSKTESLPLRRPACVNLMAARSFFVTSSSILP